MKIKKHEERIAKASKLMIIISVISPLWKTHISIQPESMRAKCESGWMKVDEKYPKRILIHSIQRWGKIRKMIGGSIPIRGK